MWYDVHFEKGKKATSRTPSNRQVEAVRVYCESDKEEDIKKAAQSVMRKAGQKGFRMTHYRKRASEPVFVGQTFELPGKKPFRVWNENGTLRQSGWISLPGVLFEGTPDEAGLVLGGMKALEMILNNTFDPRQPDYFKPREKGFGTSEGR